MVLGIIGLILFSLSFVGLVLNSLAIIFGGIGLARANSGVAPNRGMAVAGLVLGIVGVALFSFYVAAVVSMLNNYR